MSHSVEVTLIADQEIELIGKTVNIHNLRTIHLDSGGAIVGYELYPDIKADEIDNWKPGEGRFVDAGTAVFKLKKK